MHLFPLPVPYTWGIVFIYISIAPMFISSIRKLDQPQTSRQHFGIWGPSSPMPPIRTTWELILFKLSSALFSINMMTIHVVSLFTRIRHRAVNRMDTPPLTHASTAASPPLPPRGITSNRTYMTHAQTFVPTPMGWYPRSHQLTIVVLP